MLDALFEHLLARFFIDMLNFKVPLAGVARFRNPGEVLVPLAVHQYVQQLLPFLSAFLPLDINLLGDLQPPCCCLWRAQPPQHLSQSKELLLVDAVLVLAARDTEAREG